MAKQSDKVSKLRRIINGTLSVLSLLPPQSYVVFVEDSMEGVKYRIHGEVFNEQEFSQWHENTVREEDRVMYMQDSPGCDPIIDNPAELYKLVAIDAPKQPIQGDNKRRKGKAFKQPEPAEIKPLEIEILPIEETKPDHKLRTFGLLSEYGITWGLIREPMNKHHQYHENPPRFF